jgi:DNA-binding MarR family transcriptional regulator
MSVNFQVNDKRLRTWLILHQAYNMLIKVEDLIFPRAGITSQQHSVLMAMKYIEGPVTPSIIAHWLDRSTNSITTLVDRMEKAGLVKRQRNKEDRRSIKLVMTKQGKEVLKESTKIGRQAVDEVLGGIPEEELDTLIELLEKVRNKAFSHIYPGKTIKEAKAKAIV